MHSRVRRSVDGSGAAATDIERMLQSGVRAPDHDRLAPARCVLLQGEGLKRLGDTIADALHSVPPTTGW
jgi:hypothetical protein